MVRSWSRKVGIAPPPVELLHGVDRFVVKEAERDDDLGHGHGDGEQEIEDRMDKNSGGRTDISSDLGTRG